jgi:hypothetical protein
MHCWEVGCISTLIYVVYLGILDIVFNNLYTVCNRTACFMFVYIVTLLNCRHLLFSIVLLLKYATVPDIYSRTMFTFLYLMFVGRISPWS